MTPHNTLHPRPDRIVCVGEALIDLIGPSNRDWGEIEAFVPRIGGAPANTSVAISRLGGNAAFVGCRADDEPGEWIAQRLSSEGVDVSLLVTVPDTQTRLAIVTGPAEQRSFRFYGDDPADARLSVSHVEEARLETAAAVIVSSLALKSEPSREAMHRLLEICRSNSVPIVFDPNPRPGIWPDPDEALAEMKPFLESARILKLGAGEPELLGLAVQELRAIQSPGSVLVITDGRNGCRYWYGDERSVVVPSKKVEPVDSTGAGDAFSAALTFRFVERGGNLSYDDFLFANAVGAITTTREGAMDALPTREIVENLVVDSGS